MLAGAVKVTWADVCEPARRLAAGHLVSQGTANGLQYFLHSAGCLRRGVVAAMAATRGTSTWRQHRFLYQQGVQIAIVQRSQSRVKGTQFNVQSTINLPNGQVKRLLVNDIFFSSVPVNVSGRSDYVTYSLPYEAAEGKFL